MDSKMGSGQLPQGGAIMSQGQHRQRVPDIHLASRDLITRMQIETLLQVFGMTTSALGHFLRTSGEPEVPNSSKPLMTEGTIAVENTLQATCERLEKILHDDTRWSTAFQDKVERDYEAAYKLQCDVLAAQRAGANEVLTPHFRYRPTLLRLTDDSWCAFLGNVDHMDLGIVGVGPNPQSAVEAFDDAFRGVTNPEVLKWCEEREKTLEEGTNQQTPFPVQPEQKNEKTLDTDRDRENEKPSSEGGDLAGDSEGARP